MKKVIITIVLFGFIITGCKTDTENPDFIKNQIMEYKIQVENLNEKIFELEKKLDDNGQSKEAIKVEAEIVESTNFEQFIDVSAVVDADLNSLISPQMNGQITKIYVKEGQFVSKGQTLAKLNDEVLLKNLAQLETSLLLADTLYEKQKKLWEDKVISEVEYLRSKNQKETIEKNIDVIKSQIRLSTITAPFSGIVDRIFGKEGEIGVPGKTLIQLVNLNKMIATADVSEKYLPSIKVGDEVSISFKTYPDLNIESKVYQIGNVIDPNNRTFRIKVMFDNIDSKIKPNMLSVIRFQNFQTNNAIVVPTNILTEDIDGWYLYTIENKDGKDFAAKKYVKIGNSNENQTVIESGLKEGDKVITKGFNLLKNGMEVKIQ